MELLRCSGLKGVLRTDYARGAAQTMTPGMPGCLLCRLPAYWGLHSQAMGMAMKGVSRRGSPKP